MSFWIHAYCNNSVASVTSQELATGISERLASLTYLFCPEKEEDPAEVINLILKAPAELLYLGGIGTYVKARHESHVDAGDKANDTVRINGADLRVKVVGEGANLGLTQAGRIEFAEAGTYMFHAHQSEFTELGWMGFFEVVD